MCGRIRIDDDGAAIAAAVGAALGEGAALFSAGEMHPGGRCLVVISTRVEVGPPPLAPPLPGNSLAVATPSGLRLGPLRWGIARTPKAASRDLVYHARIETLSRQPLFREAAARRRGFLPVHRFDEWNSSRIRFGTAVEDGSLLRLGIVWNGEGFAVVTREAFGPHVAIHPRIPLVISDELLDGWCSATPLEPLLPKLLMPVSGLVTAPIPAVVDPRQPSLF